jgi:hypothetical protein
MIEGTIIAESLTVGSTLAGIPLTVGEIRRAELPYDPPAWQPRIWTGIEFAADDSSAQALASRFAEILAEPGWYVNYSSAAETFVVYRDKIFRYPRGDAAGRAEAQAYGRAHGVPEGQLDWTE